MAVNRVPVLKRCRSLGLEPGYLGIDKKSNRELKRANRKMSEYGSQLREKQKAKFIYGVLEKPFRNYFEKASRMKGQVGENLMVLLERRIDNVIFRLGFARTRREARQIVGHRHVLVNGKIVNIPSYLISAGDVVEIKEKQRISPYCTLGAYYFRTCQLYEDLYHEYYDVPRDDLVNGEKYIAPLYDYLLSKGGDIYISDIAPERVHVLGTPEELEAFLKEGDA